MSDEESTMERVAIEQGKLRRGLTERKAEVRPLDTIYELTQKVLKLAAQQKHCSQLLDELLAECQYLYGRYQERARQEAKDPAAVNVVNYLAWLQKQKREER